jgi:hypothetical protein
MKQKKKKKKTFKKKRRWKKSSFHNKTQPKKAQKNGHGLQGWRKLDAPSSFTYRQEMSQGGVPTNKGHATKSEMWSNKGEGLVEGTFTKCEVIRWSIKQLKMKQNMEQ